jgi:hypothetical protein
MKSNLHTIELLLYIQFGVCPACFFLPIPSKAVYISPDFKISIRIVNALAVPVVQY